MTRDKRVNRMMRRVRLVFAIAAVLYAVLGAVLVYQAYAQQTYSSIVPTPNKPFVKVPTGSDDKSVEAFFDLNELKHVASLEETYHVNNIYYWGTMYLVIGVSIIVFYFLTFSWYARYRRGSDLYSVEVYNAVITERDGPVDPFNWASYAILLTYMAYYAAVMIIGGQYY